MKINNRTKNILKCTTKKSDCRTWLETPWLDDKGNLVATNGKIIAILPNVSENGDTPGHIPADFLLSVKSKIDVSCQANGNVKTDDIIYNRPNERYLSSEEWERCIKQKEREKIEITINAKLLNDLQSAIGDDSITLTINKNDNQSPIIAIGTHGHGAIMPTYKVNN